VTQPRLKPPGDPWRQRALLQPLNIKRPGGRDNEGQGFPLLPPFLWPSNFEQNESHRKAVQILNMSYNER